MQITEVDFHLNILRLIVLCNTEGSRCTDDMGDLVLYRVIK